MGQVFKLKANFPLLKEGGAGEGGGIGQIGSNYDIWEWKCINAAVIHRQGSSTRISPSKNKKEKKKKKKGKANHRRERGGIPRCIEYIECTMYIYKHE